MRLQAACNRSGVPAVLSQTPHAHISFRSGLTHIIPLTANADTDRSRTALAHRLRCFQMSRGPLGTSPFASTSARKTDLCAQHAAFEQAK